MVMKKLEGHGASVMAVAVSGDGKLIASGDDNGELIAWDGDTGDYFAVLFSRQRGTGSYFMGQHDKVVENRHLANSRKSNPICF